MFSSISALSSLLSLTLAIALVAGRPIGNAGALTMRDDSSDLSLNLGHGLKQGTIGNGAPMWSKTYSALWDIENR